MPSLLSENPPVLSRALLFHLVSENVGQAGIGDAKSLQLLKLSRCSLLALAPSLDPAPHGELALPDLWLCLSREENSSRVAFPV